MLSVGRRSPAGDAWEDQARLARTAAFLRGSAALVPRGVFRFSSFEEADAVDEHDADRYARAPEPADVIRICRALNEAGA